MDIIEKAKELGRLIAESEEMEQFKRAEADFEGDEAAQKLYNEFRMLQIEVVHASKEMKSQEEIDAKKDKLMEKQKEVEVNEIIKGYFVSKHGVDQLVQTVNNVMIHSISGEEACDDDKCASCGGGCR